MIDISVIIVNYNVRYFIEQCLTSVFKAQKRLNIEVIVVDNNSIDNSVESIKNLFPQVAVIENKDNVGFAKANNQAIRIAKGKYFLLLNPDTIIEEDTLIKIYDFMESHDEAGALGVKLIDGEGQFLPESKRSLPTLSSSFFRLTGLSKLFPKSKVFNKYNLGYLDEDDINEVEVLCGAFMFVRSEILPQVGYLDEDFFMYGEDIDYSFRIINAGHKIYYFPETTIIHFKGESTKKSSIKYHNIFYKAMAIFARKHYGGKAVNPLLWLINIAVFMLAIVNYFKRIIGNYLLPIIDVLLFYIVLFSVQKFWANYHFNNPDYYDIKNTSILFLIFSLIWVISIYFYNGYRKKKIVNSIRGVVTGTLIILIVYSLLPETYRYSRAIILISSIFNLIFLLLLRLSINFLFPKVFNQDKNNKKTVIVGAKEEVDRVNRILDINGVDYQYMGALAVDGIDLQEYNKDFLGYVSKLNEIIDMMKIDEVIFCLKNIEMSDVVNIMSDIGTKVKIKIIPDDTHSIIGSSGRNSRGEFYSMDMDYKLKKSNIRFVKYSMDFIIAIFLLILYPLIFIINKKFSFVSILNVLSGSRTWISYVQKDESIGKLPKIKKGVFEPMFINKNQQISENDLHNINVNYARNYSIWLDLDYLFKHLFNNKKLN